MTGASLALAFACRSKRLALARVLPLLLGLVMIGGALLAVVAFRQHDPALAVVVLVDVALLRYALVLRGRVLTARLAGYGRSAVDSNRGGNSRRWSRQLPERKGGRCEVCSV